MPYKRRRTGGGSRLSWSSYKLGQLVDRAAAIEREDANWQRAQSVLANPESSGLNVARDAQGLRGMAGRGTYFGKTAGGLLGGAIGGRFGLASAGADIGSRMGDVASDYVMSKVPRRFGGSGAYMAQNALVAGTPADYLDHGVAMSSVGSNDEQGAITITHREYVQDLYAPGTVGGPAVAFSNLSFPLNPGLQQSFTFGSQVAENYDEYEFVQCIWAFRSTTTDIGSSTNGQCGTVVMATDYNASKPPFADKQTMIEYSGAHSCKITESMVHGVECDPGKSSMSPRLFVRSNPVMVGQDLKTYDKGTFQIAVCNCPPSFNGFPIGELWVEYTIVLRKPKLFVSRGLNIDQDLFCTALTTSPSFFQPFGTSADNIILSGQQNNIGCTIIPALGSLDEYAAGLANLGSGEMAIVFPPWYTSNVEICLNITTLEGFGVLEMPTGQPIAIWVSGNINPVFDITGSVVQPTNPIVGIPAGFSNFGMNQQGTFTGFSPYPATVQSKWGPCSIAFAPGNAGAAAANAPTEPTNDTTTFLGTDSGITQPMQTSLKIHMFVKAATQGISNIVLLKFSKACGLFGCTANMSIAQYQTNGLTSRNGTVPYVNAQGTVVVP